MPRIRGVTHAPQRAAYTKTTRFRRLSLADARDLRAEDPKVVNDRAVDEVLRRDSMEEDETEAVMPLVVPFSCKFEDVGSSGSSSDSLAPAGPKTGPEKRAWVTRHPAQNRAQAYCELARTSRCPIMEATPATSVH